MSNVHTPVIPKFCIVNYEPIAYIADDFKVGSCSKLEFLKSGIVSKPGLIIFSIVHISTMLNIECIFLTVFLLRKVDDKSVWLVLLSLRMRVTLLILAELEGTLQQPVLLLT
jgi:hypothetical protein